MIEIGASRWVKVEGLRIKVTPCVITVCVPESVGGDCFNDTYADEAGWEAECSGIRAQARTPEDAARMVLEQIA